MAVSFAKDFIPAIMFINQTAFFRYCIYFFLNVYMPALSPRVLWGTLQEAFFYQEGFVHFFQRARIFTQSCSNSGQSHRTPLNLSIIVHRILLSISSRPYWSMFRASSAKRAISKSILPEPFTCAKSRTRRNKALAIRGCHGYGKLSLLPHLHHTAHPRCVRSAG